jgi:hypothetical protein
LRSGAVVSLPNGLCALIAKESKGCARSTASFESLGRMGRTVSRIDP